MLGVWEVYQEIIRLKEGGENREKRGGYMISLSKLLKRVLKK